MQRNRRAAETSPCLLQHADNPVDWHPWGAAALDIARRENKPILLSVGYSACHWCHVMAHESFEDPATADTMNRHGMRAFRDRLRGPHRCCAAWRTCSAPMTEVRDIVRRMAARVPG